MIIRALKLFLIGLLLWPFLINVVGFISPFWAVFVLNDGSRSYELLSLFLPIVPFVSILFSISLILLSHVDGRLAMRLACWVFSVLYVVFSIYGVFQTQEFRQHLLSGAISGVETIMLFLAGLILIRVFKQSAVLEQHINRSA